MNRAAGPLIPLVRAVALVEVPADRATTRQVRGAFGVAYNGAAADPKAAAMVTADIKGLLIQGTAALPTVPHTGAEWFLEGRRPHFRC